MRSPDTDSHAPADNTAYTGCRCHLCPQHCHLHEGAVGRCRARRCSGGRTVPLQYGTVSSVALDPVEKKPLYHFHPGSLILSVGGYGCNLRCPFCQNHSISMHKSDENAIFLPPERLAALAADLAARPDGNLGVAYTYNEPLIAYEYVTDTARLIHENKLHNVLVTNGEICAEPLSELLPLIDAMNIDLKGFSQEFYDYVGGDLQTVLETIKLSAEATHVEVTTLIVPGRNDSETLMREEARFLSGISPDLPLHISRFFPRHHEQHLPPTPLETIRKMVEIASAFLNHVYAGNC